jgi:hypothetical protein
MTKLSQSRENNGAQGHARGGIMPASFGLEKTDALFGYANPGRQVIG